MCCVSSGTGSALGDGERFVHPSFLPRPHGREWQGLVTGSWYLNQVWGLSSSTWFTMALDYWLLIIDYAWTRVPAATCWRKWLHRNQQNHFWHIASHLSGNLTQTFGKNHALRWWVGVSEEGRQNCRNTTCRAGCGRANRGRREGREHRGRGREWSWHTPEGSRKGGKNRGKVRLKRAKLPPPNLFSGFFRLYFGHKMGSWHFFFTFFVWLQTEFFFRESMQVYRQKCGKQEWKTNFENCYLLSVTLLRG